VSTAPIQLDEARIYSFYEKVMSDMAGALAGTLCALGDRLGLFRALATGPATPDQLADRAGVDPRYARDWLGALASRGYLELGADGEHYALPPDHAAALIDDGGPMSMAGAFQQLPGMIGTYGPVLEAFRRGTGVPSEDYGDEMRSAMDRTSAGWFEHQLVPHWVGACPGLGDKLECGARVADVGCGSGRALIRLARAFPNCELEGFDTSAPALDRAQAAAVEAGVEDRVRFERRDAALGLPGNYDLVTMFDVLHDIAQPLAVLRGIHASLRDGGTFLLLEINSGERPQDNAGPVGTLMYATSVMYCLPTSIAGGADGLGTLGLPESSVRALCAQAGFAEVQRLPIMNPFHALYAAKDRKSGEDSGAGVPHD
jgi:SAM-dependent methyltransferase